MTEKELAAVNERIGAVAAALEVKVLKDREREEKRKEKLKAEIEKAEIEKAETILPAGAAPLPAEAATKYSPEVCEPADSVGGQKLLKVMRIPFNPRMVEGQVEGGGGWMPVYVGRNEKFAIGDEIVCEEMAEQEGCWEFKGMADDRIPVDNLGLPRDRRRPYQ